MHVYNLDKCGLKGTMLLETLEEYAKTINISTITLDDKTKLNIECISESKNISIDLTVLKLLVNGKSWYNSLGYFSSTPDNANVIANFTCIEALRLSEDTQIERIHEE